MASVPAAVAVAAASSPSGPRPLCSTILCCATQRTNAVPIPASEKGKQRAPPTPTPSPGGVRCTSSPPPRTSPAPPSPALPPPRKSPSPVASLKLKLGLDESWMSGPATGGRWWMEPASKPYFPGKMKRREKRRIAGLNEEMRPGTAQSVKSVISGVSGTTVGSRSSIGPRKEVPGSVKRYLKNPEDIERAKGTELAGENTRAENANAKRPRVKREGYTKQWARGVKATDLPPIAPRIDSNSPVAPVGGRGHEGLNAIREEASTPARLAEERSRLLLERGRCLLLLRAIERSAEGDEPAAMDVEVLRRTEAARKELAMVEEKLRIVAEKARGLQAATASA